MGGDLLLDNQRFTHWSGLALFLGGILLGVHYLIHPLGESSQYILTGIWVPAHLIGALAWVLILIGSFGFYAQYSRELGRLGSFGFILAFVGGVLRPGELLFLGSIAGPLIATQAAAMLDPGGILYFPLLLTVGLTTAIYGLGYLLLAIATLRAALVPSWAVWSIIIAVPLALGIFLLFVIGTIAGIIFSLGLFGWGHALWSGEKSQMRLGK